MPQRVLVTGASGFIGRHVVQALVEAGHVVSAPASPQLDLLDEAAVRDHLDRSSYDAIVHTATWNATRTSHRDRSQVLHANLRMFFNLAQHGGLFGRLVYFGSGAEFDRRHWQPRMREVDLGRHIPADDYGLSKYLMTLHASRSVNIWNLRLFGVYGPGEDWRIRFISNACCRVLHDLPIRIRQNLRFHYTHVSDIAAITCRWVEDPPAERVMNVASSEVEDLRTIANLVAKASGRAVDIEMTLPGMGREYSADTTVFDGAMPDHTFTSLREGIASLYSWYAQGGPNIDPAVLVADDGTR